MIGKIFRLIKEGKSVSIDEITESLGVSREITIEMLNDLVRRGYLKEVIPAGAGGCGSSCSSCSGSCGINTGRIKLWELTKNQ